MLLVRNLVKFILGPGVTTCLLLSCVFFFFAPIAAQPGGFHDLPPGVRKYYTQDRLELIEKFTQLIQADARNIALYKRRLSVYFDLCGLNFDNNDWEKYADKVDEDLSHIIALERTEDNLFSRGWWRSEQLRRLPLQKLSELYPHNRFFDSALSDYLEALQLVSDPEKRKNFYSTMSILYGLRLQKLASIPNLPKLRAGPQLKLILADFNYAIKYGCEALEFGISSHADYVALLRGNLEATYLTSADAAQKLGASKLARALKEIVYNYVNPRATPCLCYAAWVKIYYQQLKKFREAKETLVVDPLPNNLKCAEVSGNNGFRLDIQPPVVSDFAPMLYNWVNL